MYNPLRMLADAAGAMRRVRREHGISPGAQLRQVMVLRGATGMSRAEYHLFRLWRPHLSLADRLTYLSLRERRSTEFLRNPPRAGGGHRVGTKTEGADRIAAAGLRVPDHLAVISAGAEPDRASRVPVIATVDAMRDLVAGMPADGIVIKPESGYGGQDIRIVVSASRHALTLVSGEQVPVDAVWRSLAAAGPWRVERRILAHDVVSAWLPGATPTLRLTTAVVNGRATVHAAIIKVNCNPSGVDNFQAGNLAGAVDPVTGTIGPVVDYDGRRWFDRHPGSGTAISGVQVPEWPEYVAAACRAAPAFLPLRSLGWDIAISRDGPVVLEANPSWSEIIQLPLDRGVVRGPFLRLLRDAGAGALLDRRERTCPGWIDHASALE